MVRVFLRGSGLPANQLHMAAGKELVVTLSEEMAKQHQAGL